MKNKFLLSIYLVILIIVLGIYYNAKSDLNENVNSVVNISDNYQDTNKDIYIENITSLQKSYNNTDIKATIEILNENFEYPVLQGNDNDYYLTHTPERTQDIYGSIFLDYRVDVDRSKKLLIFGHSGYNFEAPFNTLEKYYDRNYFDNHRKVLIKTKEKVRQYELFSMYIETKDFSYMKVNFKEGDYVEQLKMFKDKSWYDVDVELNNDTNILLLQTCSNHKDYRKYNKKYLILVFKETNFEQFKEDIIAKQ